MGDEYDELVRRLREACVCSLYPPDKCYACQSTDALERQQRNLKLALESADQMKACWNAACEDIAKRDQTIAELRRIAARAVVHEAACTYTYYAYTRDCDCGAIENAIRKDAAKRRAT